MRRAKVQDTVLGVEGGNGKTATACPTTGCEAGPNPPGASEAAYTDSRSGQGPLIQNARRWLGRD